MKPLSRVTALSFAVAAPACCVAATMKVRTPRGEVPAGALAVGDCVTSIDLETGVAVVGTIVQIRRARRECLALRWPGGMLVCTPDHPLYSPARGTYRPASDWVTGDASTLLACHGEAVDVVAVEAATPFAGVQEVVDLTLEGEPRNFVANGVVVHNKSGEDKPYDPGYVDVGRDGPSFTLTAEDPERRFRVRACLSGADPRVDLLDVTANAETPTLPAVSGAVRLAISGDFEIYAPAEDHNEVVPGDGIRFYGYDNGASCSDGVVVAFSRVADLPDEGIPIDVTQWRLVFAIDISVLPLLEISVEDAP